MSLGPLLWEGLEARRFSIKAEPKASGLKPFPQNLDRCALTEKPWARRSFLKSWIAAT